MRYAVLSDIHGNLEALTAVLDVLATEKIDRYLCLGDTVGYGADPVACLSKLEKLGAVSVAGNHEWGVIGKLETRWFNEAARAAIAWTRDQLGFTELDALRRLPLTTVEGPCTLAHAMLKQPERFEYLVEAGQAMDSLRASGTLFCLAGHTHQSVLIEYDRAAKQLGRMLNRSEELAEVSFEDDAQRWRYLLNPGSVGQPRDGDPRASCAIIDLKVKRLSVRRVAYDHEAAARKIREAGLPGFLADRLALGR